MEKEQRITLISRDPHDSGDGCSYVRQEGYRPVFVNSLQVVKFALASLDLDIERVILDRSATAQDFLELLASLPPDFRGDILMISADGSGFLSATGRGGDRVLYALKKSDVAFYLETFQIATTADGLRNVHER
jgi:hypothetical protein